MILLIQKLYNPNKYCTISAIPELIGSILCKKKLKLQFAHDMISKSTERHSELNSRI